MQIVVTGGTGFIGRALCTALSQGGHRVIVLSRRPAEAQRLFVGGVTVAQWDDRDDRQWERYLDEADAVVNLAGAPIVGARWSHQRKQVLLDSRVLTTRRLVSALSRCATKPRTLVSASGIGYYGASDDRLLDEQSARGHGFLADLCEEWEAEARRASEFGVRVVVLRTGMVLDHDGRKRGGRVSSGCGWSCCGRVWCWITTVGRFPRWPCRFDSSSAVPSCRGRSGCLGSTGAITLS